MYKRQAISPGIQGGPLMHVIAAKAVCFGEALKPEFTEYAKQIVKNLSLIHIYVTSVPHISLSIVLGSPIIFRPSSERRFAVL